MFKKINNVLSIYICLLGVVAHTYNSSTQEFWQEDLHEL